MNELDWYGFDLDGTLAFYEPGDYNRLGFDHIGEPIKGTPIWDKLVELLAQGNRVKICTARVDDILRYAGSHEDFHRDEEIRLSIQNWCLKNIGRELEITNRKDGFMKALFDDRAYNVVSNTGLILDEQFCRPAA